MSRYIENWLGKSRMIGALAVLSTLLCSTGVAHAAGSPCQAQPPTITSPQPTLPQGFTEEILFRGCLVTPTAISFNASMTTAFVAEKGGKVWSCDLSTSVCTLFADLTSEVCSDEERGLLGLAVDPLNDGNVYVLYTTPPATGPCTGEVPTSGQLSLLTAAGETQILPLAGATSPWCFFYTSHSIGGLAFGVDNTTLYVSAGEGASFNAVDIGQLDNACGDSTDGTTVPQGAFRSQGPGGGVNTPYLEGAILRITNPGTASQSFDVVAFGLRNPFRFALVPGTGTDEMYVGNVGWDTWEAIDHIDHVISSGQNFGWPCYEGPEAQPLYQSTGYCGGVGGVTAPFFAYAHQSYVTSDDSTGQTCGGSPTGGGPDQNGTVISAIGFTDGTSTTYPPPFKSALYFGDLLRQCIWTMQPPDNTPQTFAKGLEGGPVDLKAGPGGDLYYVDLTTSTVRRFTAQLANSATRTGRPDRRTTQQ